MKKVKFGIIGTGAIAKLHAEALSMTDNAELYIVYDKVPERAASFAQKHNCRMATSFDELLASEVEAVTIATPSGLHAEVAIPAARAGKHVLCEKPLEVTVSKTNDLVRTCESSNVRLSAVFQSRFSRSVQTIKKAVDAGRFGEPVLAAASVRWYRNPEYYASTACAPGFPRRVELSGTKGSVMLEDDRIIRWSFTDEKPEDEEIRRIFGMGEEMHGGSRDPNAISPEGHRRQISELAEAILNGHGLTTPGAEGKRAVELICAVYESARTGTTIKFL